MNSISLLILAVGLLQVNTDQRSCKYEKVEARLFRALCSGLKDPSWNARGVVEEPKYIPGTTYIQWGKSNCSGDGTELIYNGYVGGSSHTDYGSQVNLLCLHKEPQYRLFESKPLQHPWITAAIYSIHQMNIPNTAFDHSKYTLYAIPCSVCRTIGKTSVIMIPGRRDCMGDWKKEYSGYLYGGNPTFKAASEYLCVDEDPDRLEKASSFTDKPIINPAYSKCNDVLPCPPYVDGRQMTCVVCAK